MQFSELMPKLAQRSDKTTLIRSMSYTPNGLFNHTAAIYQMMTGYTTDKVSPSGQLEPPIAEDFPTSGSHISQLKPPNVPMLPFVMPRPLQESNVVGKGGTAGFLGKAYDPYPLYQDPAKPIKMDDLSLARGHAAGTLEGPLRAAEGHQRIDAGSGEGRERVTPSTSTTTRRSTWCLSGKAREAFDLTKEPDKCASATAGTPSARACCWRAGWSRPARASCR